MDKQPIFYDPARRRWKRATRILTGAAVAGVVLLGIFILQVMQTESLPQLIVPAEQTAYPVKARLFGRHRPVIKHRPLRRRKTHKVTPAPGLPAGVRAAFYVNWDPASYADLRQHIRDIDVLFAEWLHASAADGSIQSSFDSQAEYGRKDSAILDWARHDNPDLSIVPLINNNIGDDFVADTLVQMFADPAARQNFRNNLIQWLNARHFRGVNIDFENIPSASQADYRTFIAELYQTLQANHIKMYIDLPVGDDDYDLGYFAANSDVVVLMDYDQHWATSAPGPVAGQDWFVRNAQAALKLVPRQKLMLGIANYGYDWPAKGTGQTVSDQRALMMAQESGSDVQIDPESLNPHLDYQDDAGHLHHVWFTDAMTAVNEMRGAAALGISDVALWRLGSGDGSLWPVFDKFNDNAQVIQALGTTPPGNNIDTEGNGDIFHISSTPQPGIREIHIDRASNLIVSEHYLRYPTIYRLENYGSAPKTLAISFDDGPDPRWTPQLLKILKDNDVPATFFVIGVNAENAPELLRQEYRNGDEIGNHTFLHPDVSQISNLQFDLELNTTQRLIETVVGAKTVLFRPPYGVDSTPESAAEVRPLEMAQKMGYALIGNGIDPHDWQPGRSSQQIISEVMSQVQQGDGTIILLHDGGGNRSQTVAALPVIIRQLKAQGYHFVPVSALMGETRAQVMPPLSSSELFMVRTTGWVFDGLRWLETAIVWIFLLGIILMMARVILIGALAAWQKFRPHRPTDPDYAPPLAVLIPAYNEEKVVANTVRSVLNSDYGPFRVLVVNDGSTDGTLRVLHETFDNDPRVVILDKPNGGKSAALNYAIGFVTEDAFVTIDADTQIESQALKKLAAHLSDAAVAAIAGNAKVGNRINMITWFQAGEYITSQNLERRALDALNCITVVPGAIGCWRTEVVRRLGGFNGQTAAEDADLTVMIRREGYRIVYEDGAIAWTEAPVTVKTLMKQRFRWSYGILQTVWKHRDAIGREGTLGKFGLPNVIIFQVIMPLFGPITDLMLLFALLLEWFQYSSHPASWTPDSLYRLLFFFAVLMLVDMLGSVLAFAMEHREQWSLVGSVLLQRVVYRHVMAVVMFRTLKQALKGGDFTWGKLDRTGTIKTPMSVGSGR